MQKVKDFTGFNINNNEARPSYKNGEPTNKLPPGIYSLKFNPMTADFWFEKQSFTYDNILDLPSPEYSQVVSEMRTFLDPETKQRFLDLGFVYKRSALLFGEPGTGKSIIVNRVAKDVVDQGGIVLWAEQLALVEIAFRVLNSTQPESLTLVVMEEFDSIAGQQETRLLSMLDGQTQKENVMYLATTNYIDKISKRLYRPGRFSSVIEVQAPIAEARQMFLENKLGKGFNDMFNWVKHTEGLTIDELKEVIQSVEILKYDFNTVLMRLAKTRGLDIQAESTKDYNKKASWTMNLLSTQGNDNESEVEQFAEEY